MQDIACCLIQAQGPIAAWPWYVAALHLQAHRPETAYLGVEMLNQMINMMLSKHDADCDLSDATASGRYLAGSFLSEENKIMVELKAAAEQRTRRSKSRQHVQSAPFSWLLPRFK